MQWLSIQMGAGKQSTVCTKAEVQSDVHVSCGQVHLHLNMHPTCLIEAMVATKQVLSSHHIIWQTCNLLLCCLLPGFVLNNQDLQLVF